MRDSGTAYRRGLLAILLLALAIRLWGIGNGLPHVFQPHEHWEFNRALRLAAGGIDLDPRTIHKGGYFYLLAVEFGVYFLILRAANLVTSVSDFAIAIVRDPTSLWLIGRATTALLGTLTVLLVGVLGRRLDAKAAGLAGAFLLALAPLHVTSSRFVTVDVPMTLLVTAALAVLLLRSDLRRFPVATLLAALAVATKFIAAILAVPFALLRLAEERSATDSILSALGRLLRRRDVWLSAALAVAVYLLLSPAAIVHPYEFARFLVDMRGNGQLLQGAQGLDGREGEGAFVAAGFYLSALIQGSGWPWLLAAAAGMIAAIRRHRREAVPFLLFALAIATVICIFGSGLRAARYLLPIVPILALYGGQGIVVAAGVMTRRIGRGTTVSRFAMLLALVCALPPALEVAREAIVLGREDTRVIAKHWVEEKIPTGSRILLQGNPAWRGDLTVPLEATPGALQQLRRATSDPGKALFLDMRTAASRPPCYELAAYGYQEPMLSLDAYLERGVEYVIVEAKQLSRPYASHFLGDEEIRDVGRSRRRFFSELTSDPRATLAAEIPVDDVEHPGPVIRIYQLRVGSSARTD
jgi:4-amino-4-deoxy-L-arabinose transferase-like glycosyltransferase